MKTIRNWAILILVIASIFYNCSSGAIINISPRNLEYVKQHAESRWSEMGFEIIGYDGFNWDFCYLKKYGGARVWHVLKKKFNTGDPYITYNGCLQRWGDEIHMYHLRAIDAIRPI